MSAFDTEDIRVFVRIAAALESLAQAEHERNKHIAEGNAISLVTQEAVVKQHETQLAGIVKLDEVNKKTEEMLRMLSSGEAPSWFLSLITETKGGEPHEP